MNEDIFGALPPLDGKGNPKKRFEVRMRRLGTDPRDGIEKAVFVGRASDLLRELRQLQKPK